MVLHTPGQTVVYCKSATEVPPWQPYKLVLELTIRVEHGYNITLQIATAKKVIIGMQCALSNKKPHNNC